MPRRSKVSAIRDIIVTQSFVIQRPFCDLLFTEILFVYTENSVESLVKALFPIILGTVKRGDSLHTNFFY